MRNPGGQAGNDSVASAADSHPGCRLFGQATRTTAHPSTTMSKPDESRHGGSGCGQQSHHAPRHRSSVHPTCIIRWAAAATCGPERSQTEPSTDLGKPRFRR